MRRLHHQAHRYPEIRRHGHATHSIPGEAMNVLLVEDHPVDMKLMMAILGSSGHEVLGKTTAEAAAMQVRARKPDLIVLDLKLPGMDGLTLARILKRDPQTRGIPIVAITAAQEQFGREQALSAGCDAYIVKPVDTRKIPEQILKIANLKGSLGPE